MLKNDRDGLLNTVRHLREDQKRVLLKLATEWNSISKHCYAAQVSNCLSLAHLSFKMTAMTLYTYGKRSGVCLSASRGVAKLLEAQVQDKRMKP